MDFDIIRWGDIDQETPQIRYETCGVGRYTVLSLEGWNVCQLLQVSLALVPRWLWVKMKKPTTCRVSLRYSEFSNTSEYYTIPQYSEFLNTILYYTEFLNTSIYSGSTFGIPYYTIPLHLAQWLGHAGPCWANIKVHVAADLLKGESFGRLRRRSSRPWMV